MEQEKLIAAFDIQDFPTVHAMYGPFVLDPDFIYAFLSKLVEGAAQYGVQALPVEGLDDIVEGGHLVSLRVMILALQ